MKASVICSIQLSVISAGHVCLFKDHNYNILLLIESFETCIYIKDPVVTIILTSSLTVQLGSCWYFTMKKFIDHS